MRLYCKKYFAFSLFLFSIILSVNAQKEDEFWKKSDAYEKNSPKKIKRKTTPDKFEIFHLNLNSFKNKLKNAPLRNNGKSFKSGTVLTFPNEEGVLEKYQIFEASIMEESLQKKYPNIRSYVGKGIDNPSSVIRFSVTSLGLHAMVLQSSKGTVYIDPYTESKESYIIYSKKNLPLTEPFECKFDEINTSETTKTNSTNVSERAGDVNDGKLRKFRLAIATTGEYSQYHLSYQGVNATATDAVKKAAVLSAINVTMTRVNGIYERDLSITMELVANNTDIIFLNADTDGFTNDDGEVLIDESQTVIDTYIGFSNYDIGHTFSTGGGGLAQINSPCTNGKARGITGSSNPIGDAYDIDYVAHEMGHQFGAHHTFNGDAGNCGGGNRNDATAVEPGSGSTLMAYAGICSPQNVQIQSDDYFHLVSIKEIWTNITLGSGTCGAITTTGNNAPTVNTLPNYTIPISTPFVLEATASDVNGDDLTYTWEQLDTEITPVPLVSTATEGPAFRSVLPTVSPKRYFPSLNTVIAGKLTDEWEVLPSVGRTMSFGVTVRDNNSEGGQTASEETLLTFVANAGPFKVTSQNTTETWDAGTAKTITWDVANTNTSPINCSYVNILFSTDGGETFPIVLASNVSNDGSHEIVVPNNTTNSGRIKIESVGNIFYSMNLTNIDVQASEFIMNFDVSNQKVCTPNTVNYSFTYNTFLEFNEQTAFSATGNPTGTTVTFNPTTATSNNTNVVMTISGITDSNVGEYNVSITGTSATTTKTTVVGLNVYSSNINAPNLVSPENNATNILKPYTLAWDEDVNAEEYEIQIAAENTFSNITEASKISVNYYEPEMLQPNTNYFWRVKAINSCGESAYSNVFNFTTENETCDVNSSADTPLNIPDNNSAGINSKINITNNKTVTDIDLTVNISHTWLEDLMLTLTSPQGTTIILASNIGGDGDNYTNTVFDDSGTTQINLGVPPYTGTFSPQGKLSNFIGEESYGEWILKVVDSQLEDTGQIVNWSIDICGIPVISDDDDKDGVTNDVDLCPNTKLGSIVDATGCPLFSLPQDNFNIEVISETCPDKNNGQIIITASESYNYTATISGSNYDFTDSLTIDNLQPSTYNLCIQVLSEEYEQCYVVEIGEGTTVSGKAEIISNKASIEISKGTSPYYVYVNGNLVLETNSSLFSVDVSHGDLVEVKTAIDCEGVFSKSIELFDEVTAYPNPTNGNFEITLPVSTKEVVIELYNMHSQLISSKKHTVIYGKVQLSLSNQPIGIYIAKIHLDKPVSLKIIKQ
ncbi:zinc-dependent metalloprotease family protein [Lutibacter sp. B1]|uniref:zinc-dependent metalloprotease family protein n=1 Tax=Lutibacter sp. B1 TaxID=2725996 RepID=UPI00145663DD|nr:zinc-dependent metalloprotease family protein [Lutibacter sp. B1]NLP57775.1 T9SS type A sorting domain-containing protein [Lutibacter sp. B1]